MDVWFHERQTEDLALGLHVKAVLRRETTRYQELLVLDTYEFGRVLVLDGAVQLTERDEFFYHEMMAHVPLFAHERPRRVLIIGGGDGGCLREVLRHPEVEEAVLCDIDERVSAAARDFFPSLAVAFDDPRARVVHEDGVRRIAAEPEAFDVVIVDSTDPVGAAVGLYQASFFQAAFSALRADGIVVAQSESPLNLVEPLLMVQRGLRSAFANVSLYLGPVPTYPSGLWSYSIARKGEGDFRPRRRSTLATRYYTPELHEASFLLPPFVQELLPAAEGG
jgi:spermidine synthase